ncbi:hypothetical protein [Haliscomenobacter hydrossis]|uniref:ArsR family transcriptional regulator n=1 Tax=Haliscomenobacter hydrossis (strain ATCC 27775 / DSM 1100 / LMG 10767 / O) TaxID=760192 RepID=F4KTD0_HALH1|nr:hypothetical protein [Haliscomenobacter hydrossis]AEE52344.1 hypothetical protein Halhy_4504 [Haliscomenobacter hydrossis DSM 1100]
MNTSKQNRFFTEGEKVSKAIGILELLCHPETSAVLRCLREWPEAAWVDLLIHTRLDADLLQHRLEMMEQAGLINKEGKEYSPSFSISQSKLRKVSALVR